MPGIMRPEIGNLAFYPSIAVFALDMRAHRRHQIVHRPYAKIGRLETESELAGRRHCVEFNARAVSIQHSVFSQSRTLLFSATAMSWEGRETSSLLESRHCFWEGYDFSRPAAKTLKIGALQGLRLAIASELSGRTSGTLAPT